MVITFTCFAFFSSCSDDPVSNNTTYYIITSVSGVVEGTNPDYRNLRAVVLKDTTLYMLNSQTLGNDNQMNMSLPAPSANMLADIDNFFLNQTGSGVNISDHDAYVNFLSLHVLDSANVLRGYINKDNRTTVPINQVGFNRLILIYSDRNLSLTGTSTQIFNNDTSVVNYNAAFGVGWNLLSQKVQVSRSNYAQSEFVSGEVAGMSWFYDGLESK